MGLAEHVQDLARIAQKSGTARFTSFLSEGEQAGICALCARSGCTPLLWGGTEEAERCVLGVFPPGDEPDRALFPFTSFHAAIPHGFTLTHRDFLGALLALGIKREVVGDILIEEENAYFFVLDAAAPLVETELGLVGRVGVSVRACGTEEIEAAGIRQKFEERSASVASMRLDAVLSAAAHLSRQEAARLIGMGLVAVNGEVKQKTTVTVQDGDKLSVRGKGKFRIEADGSATRKGRLVVRVKRYL